MRMRRTLSGLAVVVSILIPRTNAQEPRSAPAETGKDTAREQTIYVPYDKLWEVFEQKGRGVFLPYEEFMELWRTAERATPRPAAVEAPVDALVSEVSGQAEVSKDVVAFKAEIVIEVLKKGWHEVPLRLGDVAITGAAIGNNPARLIRKDPQGYCLLLEKADGETETVRLRIEFAKSYTKTPGRNSVSFEGPLAPVSRWEVRIPEPGVEVDIQPLLAATDVPDAGAGKTRVLAFVGSTPTVRIEWTPKAEGARGLKALANVKAEHRMWIDEGVVRNRVNLVYDISRAEVSRLTVEVPSDHKVVNVFDPNVREWSVEQSGEVQRITAQLFEAVKDAQSLVIELERFASETETALPLVKAVDVSRQQGVVLARVGTGLRAEAAVREGLLQIDTTELPEAPAQENWPFSYRYSALPFRLSFNIEKVQPRILADSLVELHLHPEELVADLFTVYDVQKAGVFRLDLKIPAGFEIVHVRGVAHGNAAAAAVESHHVDEKTGAVVTVNLSSKAQGAVGLALRLRKTLRQPDLLAPTGKAVTMAAPIPRAAVEGVEHENGRLVVYGPESLRVNPVNAAGLRTVSYAEASGGMPQSERKSGERPVLSFAFGDEEAALSLSAERRAPHVTVRQLLAARIESGVIKYRAVFFYDVLYSGVKSLRINLPSATAEQARITTPSIRHVVVGNDEQADVPAGCVGWRLEGETEFLGSARIEMQWEHTIAELDIGKTILLDVPRLEPVDTDRAWGQIVLAKAEGIDVGPTGEPAGLRPIDPRHDLMPGAGVRDAARAFEFHDAWSLKIRATRYEPKDVKATSIERGLVRMVITRADVTSVQAVYRMRSARQRLAIELPGNVTFDTQPVRLNGQPVSLEEGDRGRYFVPLVAMEQDAPFLLELRYVITGAGYKLLCPEFPDEPAVQQVYLCAYMPRDRVYLGSIGPWNDEFVWVLKGFNTYPRGKMNNNQLIDWVTEGLDVDRGGLGNFPTDGRQLLFSTLRPAAGEEGALSVVAARGWALQTVLLVLIIGLGLLLLPVPLGPRSIAVGCALILLVLLAVFTPSLARAAVNNASVGAAFIVLVVWVLWFCLVTLPRSPAWQERKRARAEARKRRFTPPPLPRAGGAPPAGNASPSQNGGPDNE